MTEIHRPTQEELNKWYTIHKLSNGVFAIGEPYHSEEVFCYLVKGTTADMLIDTGMGVKPLKPAIDHLLEPGKELFVLNTHGHFDHIGGNANFPDVFSPHLGLGLDSLSIQEGWTLEAMNKYDVEDGFGQNLPEDFDPKEFLIPQYTNLHTVLKEGITFDLGDREIAVLETPGHTPGSISLLDTTNAILFTSDLVYQGPLYCFDPETSYPEYVNSLRKLQGFDINIIHPGHNYPQNKPDLINQSLELFELASDPDVKPSEVSGRILTYNHPTVERLALIISTDKLPNLTR